MPVLEARAEVIGQYGVNLRRGAGLDRRVLAVIPLATEIVIYPQWQDNAQGYDWIAASYNGVFGFVVKSFVRMVTEKPPDPINKLYVGLHFAYSGELENSLDVIRQMSQDGYPPPAVLVCSDPGLIRAIKEIDKRILTIYRWVASDSDPSPMSAAEDSIPVNGATWYDMLFQRHSQAVPYADLHQLHNEVIFANNTQSVDYAKRFNDFCMQMMTRATQDGQHVTFGNFMPGVPEAKHVNAMREAFTYAEANGHWLCYHPYTAAEADGSYFSAYKGELTTPYYGLRPAAWVADFPRLNVLGGEASFHHSPRNRGEADFVRLVKEAQQMVRPYNTALRRWLLCWWTLRGKQDPMWIADDITELLPAYSAVGREIVFGK